MNIIMLAILILAAIITVPTLMYLWIKWYYNKLDRLINLKYITTVTYVILNSFATVLSFGVCVCISWIILIHKGGDYLVGQIFVLVLCSTIDIALIVSGICLADEGEEFKEYRNSFIYIIQFIFIISISMYLLINHIKHRLNSVSNKKPKSVAELLNEELENDRSI